MQLSIIILNYNVCYFLELCLQSVEDAIQNIEAEIIVVDNNSHDKSCSMVKQKFSNVTLIENKENVGFSKGNNIGVSIAKGKYICILNPDTVVAENTFETLLGFSKKQVNIGAIGCKLIDGNGYFLPESKRNIPIVKIALSKALGHSKYYYANHLKENDIAKTSILVGAFMFMLRTVYNQVNGFDEDYFMYGEDIDLSYKIEKAGYNNYYFGKTTIIHFKGESTIKNKIYAKRFYGAMQIFYKKHFKSNIVFNSIVWLGIQFTRLINSNTSTKKTTIKHYSFFSKKINTALKDKLTKPIYLISKIEEAKAKTQIIFDANTLKYQTIIEQMEKGSKKNKEYTFKILPKNANFILGSDSSKNKGEVIHF